MIMAEFSVIPIGEGPSISGYVAKAVKVVAESGLDYRTNPMGTVVEGEWDDVFRVIKESFHAVLAGCERASCTIKLDCRKTGKPRMDQKVASVEKKLGTPVRK
jgi:uncharacterized protein (TIGR00106 family)